ncbi:hypothetical protein [Klebsiella pneumoniae]|uniref:hypothetical protein n=1 Tax=Klebsiella pneumoniae TaxID=573 RepID=UPI001F4BB9EE|nr:hypothetical protein [Klebsiella pneumoniae]
MGRWGEEKRWDRRRGRRGEKIIKEARKEKVMKRANAGSRMVRKKEKKAYKSAAGKTIKV